MPQPCWRKLNISGSNDQNLWMVFGGVTRSGAPSLCPRRGTSARFSSSSTAVSDTLFRRAKTVVLSPALYASTIGANAWGASSLRIE